MCFSGLPPSPPPCWWKALAAFLFPLGFYSYCWFLHTFPLMGTLLTPFFFPGALPRCLTTVVVFSTLFFLIHLPCLSPYSPMIPWHDVTTPRPPPHTIERPYQKTVADDLLLTFFHMPPPPPPSHPLCWLFTMTPPLS